MKLINIENFELKVSEEALLVSPIRKLWQQDKSALKENFYKQMSYMYFMVDPRSPYSFILEEEERSKRIISQEGLPDNFTPSKTLEEAMRIYKEFTVTVSQELLESSLIGAKKVSQFLRDVDLTAEDDKGKPKYQVSSITSALKNVEGIVSSLQSLQKKIEQEISEKEKVRGSQDLTVGDVWAEQGL